LTETEVIDLIEKLTDKDSNSRISIQMIAEHPWLRGEFCATGFVPSVYDPDHDVVERMIAPWIDCKTRTTAYRICRRARMMGQTRESHGVVGPDEAKNCASERPPVAQT
jgi:hypothetical protein